MCSYEIYCNNLLCYGSRNELIEFIIDLQTCRTTQSVRKGSFFEKSNLSLRQIMLVLYFWAIEVSQSIIQSEAKIARHTAVDWCQFIREVKFMLFKTLYSLHCKIKENVVFMFNFKTLVL